MVRARRWIWLAGAATALAAAIIAAVALSSSDEAENSDMVFRVPSESMRPTFDVGDRLGIDVNAYQASRTPEVGDVVLFHPPVGAETNTCGATPREGEPCRRPTRDASEVKFASRVVAGPGDRVAVVAGRVIVNGAPQREPFIRPCSDEFDPRCNLAVAIEVPDGHYFLMGDNREASDDSRLWGPVPARWVVGRVT